MAASRRKQDDKNLEILRELISQNGSRYCLDCNQRGPTYVNTTIGSFVCSKCSGMLRGLTPPHRVKSISMATFTPEEMEFIKGRGNDYCRRVWLGLYEGESVNYADEQSVKDFMSDKYEKKRYYIEPNISTVVTNGVVTSKNKTKSKSGNTSSNTAALISMSPQISKSTVNNNNTANSLKFTNTLMPSVNETSHKLARPVNNLNSFPQAFLKKPVMASTPAMPPQPSVPDFPVDFATANIYNSSQSNNNNIFTTQQSPATTSYNAVNAPTSVTNDRYAALADLDSALRQQNMMNLVPKDNNKTEVNKNPFQSSSSEVFGTRNPFFNGMWNPAPPSVPVNPFMPSTNNGGFNANNPFL